MAYRAQKQYLLDDFGGVKSDTVIYGRWSDQKLDLPQTYIQANERKGSRRDDINLFTVYRPWKGKILCLG